MWRAIAAMARNLQSTRKSSSKVADESIIEAGNGVEIQIFGHERGTRRRNQHGFSIIYSIIQAPISILSCVSHPRVSGHDGVWVSNGEFSQISEMNHLMVSESMRYAILM